MVEIRTSVKLKKKRKFIVEGSYVQPKNGTILEGAKSSTEDFRLKYAQRTYLEKERRQDVKDDFSRRRGREGTKVDFSKLDHQGGRAISFDVHSPMREEMIEILNRRERDSERKRMMNKIGVEFGRIYTRYRRDAERVKRGYSNYDIQKQEKHYASQAGMWCIIKGVTPRQVLEYWHRQIKTFADGNLDVPPLSLLKSPGIIDQVACSALGSRPTSEERTARPHSGKGIIPSGKSSFSDTATLDRRLRPALLREGFDLSEYNDRFLLTIQKMAMNVASGRSVFVSGKLKPMVNWASHNLYAAD
jgi:hypothetical protein